MKRTIVLVGAPEQHKLDWTETTLFPASIEDNSANQSQKSTSTAISTASRGYTAQWRQLNSGSLKMPPTLTPLNLDRHISNDNGEDSHTRFFSPQDFVVPESPGSEMSGDESQPSGGSNDTQPEALSEFYDHSFAIHETLSSQSSNTEQLPETPASESGEELYPTASDSSTGIIRVSSNRRLSQAPRPKFLTNLIDIPNASYLSSIYPQTKTVDLVVGILSIAPPRKVTVGGRYGKPRKAEIVELTVGDDTKSDFCITMWLPREMHVNWKDGAHATPEGSRSALRRNLKFLRPRDVIMIQNVALSSFRGKVHGQSLKGDITKVDLLFRRKVDDDDLAGFYSIANLRTASSKDPQILKVKRVRDWLVDSVGEVAGKGRRRLDRGNEYRGARRILPADTQ